MSSINKYSLFLLGSVCFFWSCGTNTKNKKSNNAVIVHSPVNPEMLNPLLYSDAQSSYILRNMFQGLLDLDPKSLAVVPVLAKERPTMEVLPNGQMKINYTIKEDAKWDNGTPITAKDVAFTLKVIKNPAVNNPHIKVYYESIVDFLFDSINDKKFTILFNEKTSSAELGSGDYGIIPEYFYDPQGLMKNYTIAQLVINSAQLANDKNIIDFATDYNSEKRMRDPSAIAGSGPYRLVEWITDQKVVLEKKENWWGSAHEKECTGFEAYPDKITYKVVTDLTSALVALKAGDMDVMNSIKPKDFSELVKTEKFTEKFNTHTPLMLAYTFFGINTLRPQFKDVKVRQAIAHLVDIKRINETTMYGYAQPSIGPVNPYQKAAYNNDIKPYEYDVELAKKLLADAGWKDLDGDGVLDKMIDGKKITFTIDFIYNAGNDVRKKSALLFQEDARKAGIKVNVLQQEWSVFIENCKKHNFDMHYGAWVSAPVLSDYKTLYYTKSSLDGGANYSSFGNQVSDALIDSIHVELNEEKRNNMHKRMQQLLHDEVAHIFICSPTERIAISKRFDNALPSIVRPGFYEAGFKVLN